MSKIKKAFCDGKAFIGFLTAGDPDLPKSADFVLDLVRGGADLVEIGIPFSDPTAEGPVIQEANIRALRAGTTVEGVFGMAAAVREKTDIPLVFLTYLNPVFSYGYERFFARCERVGVDGIILPDLPFEEKGELHDAASRHGVALISLVAPTSAERIRTIAAEAEGFLYIVSSLGVTGVRSEIATNLAAIVEKARSAGSIPVAVGFGIGTPEQARKIAAVADGVIVGSAIVKIIGEHGGAAGPHLYEYVRSMKDAMK
jgi:tryptophan synthase alpha chain